MSPAPDILLRIVEQRRRRIAAASPIAGTGWERGAPGESPDFVAALRSRSGRAVIAEVKMGSPRLGSLVGRIEPRRQARLYLDHGATALSVVVEPDFFHGSYELLAACREASGLPTIAKDFVVDPRQLLWARAAGASAILLVAALYDRETLQRWASQAEALGLTPLVETHERDDLAKLEGRRWALVGVNHRDLRSFVVDPEHGRELLPDLPQEALRVAESGIADAADVRRLAGSGFDAFLVGESLLLAEDPGRLLEEMAA